MKNILFLLAGLLIVSVNLHAQNTPAPSTAIPGTIQLPVLPDPYLLPNNTTYSNFNFTRQWIPRTPVQSLTNWDLNVPDNIQVSTSYTNGWGASLLQVVRGQWKDVVIPFDQNLSRTKLKYLPYLDSARSKFQINPFNEQRTFYQNAFPEEEGASFTTQESVYYNNTIKQIVTSKPGKVQQWFTSKILETYLFNTLADDIKVLSVNTQGEILVGGTYGDAELNKIERNTPGQVQSIGSGPDRTFVREFTDKDKLLICKKVDASATEVLTTYYVYDDLGRIRYVLPPKAVAVFEAANWNLGTPQSVDAINKLCYYYVYNGFGSVIEEYNPDRRSNSYTLYDKRNRAILAQDSILKIQGKWRFAIYDSRDRIRMTGIVNNTRTRVDWQTVLESHTSASVPVTIEDFLVLGFTNFYPASITSCEIETYNYYDSYDDYIYSNQPTSSQPVRTFSTAFSSDYILATGIVAPQPYLFAHGLLTGKKTRVIDPSVSGEFSNSWIESVFYYDMKGNLIQESTLNPWNTSDWDVKTNQYNFSGQLIQEITVHHCGQDCEKPQTKIKKKYSYATNTGLLVKTEQSVDNSGFRPLAFYSYDDFGKVKEKWVGDIDQQKISYNIRGELTGINADYLFMSQIGIPHSVRFMDSICFETGFKNASFNGSPSGYFWRNRSGFQELVHSYGYRYDWAGRLLGADYRNTPRHTIDWKNNTQDYSVNLVTYDKNGNMEMLQQRGIGANNQPAIIDQLAITNDGNRVAAVFESAGNAPFTDDFKNGSVSGNTHYSFDENGNLRTDQNKGIGMIIYNDLDLPLWIQANGGQITNHYDATGSLLVKVISQVGITKYRYWGQFVYRLDPGSTTWVIDHLIHEEGRCRFVNNKFEYDYFVKDHLGNVRTVVTTEDLTNDPRSYYATHELASANTETLLFANIDDVRDPNPDGSYGNLMAARLNGSESDHTIGTAILIRVMAGDKLDFATYSYFEDNGEQNVHSSAEDMVNILAGTMIGGAGGIDGEEGEIAEIVNNLFSSENYLTVYDQLKEGQTDPEAPRAYLNYIAFDDQMRIVPEQSGVIQIDNTTGTWNEMSIPQELTLQQHGYFALYLSNEQHMDIHFDNLFLEHYRGTQLEEMHYYPHGMLTKAKSTSGVTPENKIQYQSKTMQDELNLQLYDFHARQYDPQLGRFWGVDPASQFPSGYTGMANNPANFVDPSGMVAYGFSDAMVGVSSQPEHLVQNESGGYWSADPTNDMNIGETPSLLASIHAEEGGTEFESGQGTEAVGNGDGGGEKNENETNSSSQRSFWSTPVGSAINGVSDWVNYNINPLYAAFNGLYSLNTGKDLISQQPMSRVEGATSLLAAIPVAKISTATIGATNVIANSSRRIAKEASDLVAANGGKNSITIRTPSKQIRYDLAGKPHNGVPTPHMQVYIKNFYNGEVRSISRESKQATPITQQDIRIIRNYLRSLGKL